MSSELLDFPLIEGPDSPTSDCPEIDKFDITTAISSVSRIQETKACVKCRIHYSFSHFISKKGGKETITCIGCRNNTKSKSVSMTASPKYTCEVCDSSFNTRKLIDVHMITIHGLGGDKQCECCHRCDVSNLNTHKYSHLTKSSLICKLCFKNVRKVNTSVKKTRTEHLMLEFLRRKPIGKYITLTDKVAKGTLCATKCRVDVLFRFPKLLIALECDEDSHRGKTQEYEHNRMVEIQDEFPNMTIVYVRWNPDKYRASNKKMANDPFNERLNVLEKCLITLSEKENLDKCSVVYLYYEVTSKLFVHQWRSAIWLSNDEFSLPEFTWDQREYCVRRRAIDAYIHSSVIDLYIVLGNAVVDVTSVVVDIGCFVVIGLFRYANKRLF